MPKKTVKVPIVKSNVQKSLETVLEEVRVRNGFGALLVSFVVDVPNAEARLTFEAP